MAGVLDKLYEGLKNVGKAAEKKKSKGLGLGKTRGALSQDKETLEEIEKEGKQYASADE